jgi:CRP/FNR family transcriptional regulator, anaerobic regulatory protein
MPTARGNDRSEPSGPPHHLLRPSLRSVPFTLNLIGMNRLTRVDREHLSAISTVLRYKAHTVVCRAGDRADSVFTVSSGAVRSYRDVGEGQRRIFAFLFAGDLFGLARRGVYVNTMETITPSTLFRIPLEPLTALLLRNPDLQFRFLCKVAHGLREAQRQAVVIGHRDPVVRVAMFLAMLEELESEDPADDATRIELPMTLRDIAEFVNLPPAAVRAAFQTLAREGSVERLDDGAARIRDRRLFNRHLGRG